MGFLAVFKVRGSGLTNKTEVDVLEALAFFMNDQSGVCFPSTDAVARIARVHPNVARKTLKELEANGLISTRQAPGCRRYFDLHLDRLPLNETAGGNDLDGVKEVEPLKDVEGVKEVEVAPLKKVEGAPLTSLSTPLKDLEPELTKELTREQRRELTSLDAPERTPWETDHLTNDGKKVEKPKATRAKPKTSCPFSPDDSIRLNTLSTHKQSIQASTLRRSSPSSSTSTFPKTTGTATGWPHGGRGRRKQRSSLRADHRASHTHNATTSHSFSMTPTTATGVSDERCSKDF